MGNEEESNQHVNDDVDWSSYPRSLLYCWGGVLFFRDI